jgi:hypothetical protein
MSFDESGEFGRQSLQTRLNGADAVAAQLTRLGFAPGRP